jgi:hypothetical protein
MCATEHGHSGRTTHYFRQMSMPNPVCPNMATATPSARRAPRRRRSSMPGYSNWTRSHPAPASVFPEGVSRKVSASMRRAHIPDTYAASGPNQEPGRILIPRRRSSRGSGAQNRPACLAMGLRDACGLSRLNDFLALWSQAHMPSCNGTSTSIHRPNPDPASAPRGHDRYKRTHCLWLEQFQIPADSGRSDFGLPSSVVRPR